MAEGEGKVVEFKAAARWNTCKGGRDEEVEVAVVRTIAGLLNTEGGTLLIGVNDAGVPVGLASDTKLVRNKNKDGFQTRMIDTLTNEIGKPASTCIDLHFEPIDDLTICRVDVAPSREPGYFGPARRFFVRLTGATHELDPQQTVDYVRTHFPR